MWSRSFSYHCHYHLKPDNLVSLRVSSLFLFGHLLVSPYITLSGRLRQRYASCMTWGNYLCVASFFAIVLLTRRRQIIPIATTEKGRGISVQRCILFFFHHWKKEMRRGRRPQEVCWTLSSWLSYNAPQADFGPHWGVGWRQLQARFSLCDVSRLGNLGAKVGEFLCL